MPRMMRRRLHRNSSKDGLGSWITSAVVTIIASDLARPQSRIRHFAAKLLSLSPKPHRVVHSDYDIIEENQEEQIENSHSKR